MKKIINWHKELGNGGIGGLGGFGGLLLKGVINLVLVISFMVVMLVAAILLLHLAYYIWPILKWILLGAVVILVIFLASMIFE